MEQGGKKSSCPWSRFRPQRIACGSAASAIRRLSWPRRTPAQRNVISGADGRGSSSPGRAAASAMFCIAQAASAGATAISTTEKDFVKWRPLLAQWRLEMPIYRPLLAMQFSQGGEALATLLASRIPFSRPKYTMIPKPSPIFRKLEPHVALSAVLAVFACGVGAGVCINRIWSWRASQRIISSESPKPFLHIVHQFCFQGPGPRLDFLPFVVFDAALMPVRRHRRQVAGGRGNRGDGHGAASAHPGVQP